MVGIFNGSISLNPLGYLQTVGTNGFVTAWSQASLVPTDVHAVLENIQGVIALKEQDSPAFRLVASIDSFIKLGDEQKQTAAPYLRDSISILSALIDSAVSSAVEKTAQAIVEGGVAVVSAGEDEEAFGVHDAGWQIDSDNPYVVAGRKFSYNVFERVADAMEDGANLFISPYSIATALRMVMGGAVGETLAGMQEALASRSLSLPDQYGALLALKRALESADPAVTFKDANTVLVNPSVTLKHGYVDQLMKAFESSVQSLSPGMEGDINRWIAERTDQMIKDMLADGSIDAMTAMMLINAIYFRGDWTDQFDPRKTTQAAFKLPHDNYIAVPMMWRTGRYRYHETNDAQMIALPYGNGQFSMVVILPKGEPTTFSRFKRAKSYSSLAENIRLLQTTGSKQLGLIRMPRFNIEQGLELKDVLAVMGMGIAFDIGGHADFSRMVQRSPMPLYLSSVLHKARAEVDEKGTKAAAVTVATMTLRGGGPELDFTMVADRPFLFMIQHNPTQLPIFIGWLADPKK